MQLQASFILEAVYKSLKELYSKSDGERLLGLFRQLSYFDVEESLVEAKTDVDPLVYVYSNIISRGLPTYSTIYLEKEFSRIFQKTHLYTDEQSEEFDKYKYTDSYMNHRFDEKFVRLMFRALHIIDPRFGIDDVKNGDLNVNFAFGSVYESEFYDIISSKVIGKHSFQILKGQQSLDKLLRFSPDENGELDKIINGSIDSFIGQDVDFIYEFPSPQNKASIEGLVVEIDGLNPEHGHGEKGQVLLDDLRDDAIRKSKRGVFRLKTNEFDNFHEVSDMKQLKEISKNHFVATNEYNFNNPIYNEPGGLDAMQFALIPIAVARIQKVILDQVKKGVLKLESDSWRIGVIERDIPCAHLALEDFKETFRHLFALEGNSKKLPQIELSVYNSPEFKDCKLSAIGPSFNLSNAIDFKGDILIDISVLLRSSLRHKQVRNLMVRNYIQVYSANNIVSRRCFETDSLVVYKNAPKSLEDRNVEHLAFFLKSFSRYKNFRNGQIEIINSALKCESVIGLLPTGGGKSMTYQICSLLQPGITIVIDPIKSLMQDQYEGLLGLMIDAAQFINSSIRIPFIRERRQEKLEKGECLINFVSPERLQIKRFRDSLLNMHSENKVYFSYCVIDEAHCVSEWGHDFRTAYLKLGENARQFCKVKNSDQTIPIFGLTATASFDVLADVKRELQLEDESIKKANELSERKELNYLILQSSTSTSLADSEFKLRQAIGKGKQETVLEFIHSLPSRIEELNKKYELTENKEIAIKKYDSERFYFRNAKGYLDNAVLVFCPYKKATTNFGVESVASLLKKVEHLELATFYGSDDADNESEDKFMLNQSRYIGNELNILVATKAFGMGINKLNVRSTIHLNYPSSIEAFVQEAGRSGRDGKTALCAIVFSDYPKIDKDILMGFHQNSFRGINKETAILFELLSEITYPVDSSEDSISRYVFENSGTEVSFNLYPKDNPTSLYVQKGYKDGFGCLNLTRDMSYNFDRSNYSNEESEAVLSLVKNFLIQNGVDRSNISEWLKREIEIEPKPGIEERLKRISIGEPLVGDIIVGFRNNRIWKMSKYLRNNVEEGSGYTELIIAEACKYLKDPSEFIEKLELKHFSYYNSEARISLEHHEILLKWLIELRDESDTYKAIFRLSVIKAIDDFEIDYNKKCLYLKINKRKSDQEYIDNLKAYYLRYLSREDVNERMAKLEGCYGNTIIQKCLSDLARFVDETIARKRLSAIDSMEQACLRGLQDPDDMRTSIRTYFDSKYVDDLRKKTRDGLEQSPDVLWHFMEESKGLVDNLEHLLGSSRRMLDDRPDNPVFILLQCFSLFLLYTEIKDNHLIIKNEDLIVTARNEFVRGIGRYEFLGENIEEILKSFKEKILKCNSKLDTFINSNEEHIWLKIHSDWLANFNTKFYDNERN